MYKVVLQTKTGATELTFSSRVAAIGVGEHLFLTLCAGYVGVFVDSDDWCICYERIKMPDGRNFTTVKDLDVE